MSRFLSDIGLILEYADILAGIPDPSAPSALLDTQLCLQHVASLARMHLPFICGKGWPALAHQVTKLAAQLHQTRCILSVPCGDVPDR